MPRGGHRPKLTSRVVRRTSAHTSGKRRAQGAGLSSTGSTCRARVNSERTARGKLTPRQRAQLMQHGKKWAPVKKKDGNLGGRAINVSGKAAYLDRLRAVVVPLLPRTHTFTGFCLHDLEVAPWVLEKPRTDPVSERHIDFVKNINRPTSTCVVVLEATSGVVFEIALAGKCAGAEPRDVEYITHVLVQGDVLVFPSHCMHRVSQPLGHKRKIVSACFNYRTSA